MATILYFGILSIILCQCSTDVIAKEQRAIVPYQEDNLERSSDGSTGKLLFVDPSNLALSGSAVTGLAFIGLTGIAVVALIVPFVISVFTATPKEDEADGDEEEKWKFPFDPWFNMETGGQFGDRSFSGRTDFLLVVAKIAKAVDRLMQSLNDRDVSKMESNQVTITNLYDPVCMKKLICESAQRLRNINKTWSDRVKRFLRFLDSLQKTKKVGRVNSQLHEAWNLGQKGTNCSKIFSSCLGRRSGV